MEKYINDDFVRLFRKADTKSDQFLILAFGDKVELLEERGKFIKLRALTHFDGTATGWAKNSPALSFRDTGIVKFSMIDVQQGDGMALETPDGKIVLIDGGDNKLFARHLAARFRHRGISKDNPLEIEALIITHGDADHFDGLNDFVRSEKQRGLSKRKRLFAYPKRILHNGFVKASSKVNGKSRPSKDMFGSSVELGDETYITDLYDDPREATEQNVPFKRWIKSIDHWATRGPIAINRVAFGDGNAALFSFLEEEGIGVEVQGPFTDKIVDPNDGQEKEALRFFRAPKKSPDMHLGTSEYGSISASHTVNGHSIALRLTFGNVRMNLTGDLNRPAMQLMREKLNLDDLEAEIVKAPHHGSADFDFEALKAMKPVVAIISSGDENPSKEHIHPRATLMAALGKVMRQDTGIILNTELAAFFATRNYAHRREDLKTFFKNHGQETFTRKELQKMFAGKIDKGDPEHSFYAFERTNFGIIHIRTDGERALVFTHSGKKNLNEAYSMTVGNEASARKVFFKDKAVTR